MKNIRKLRSRRKILIFICVIVMFFLGTAYSALSQNLTLEGTITIPKKDSSFTATITKNTIFSFFWRSTYDIKITNNGTTDINSWFAVISVSNLTSESEVSAQTFISNGLNSYSVNLEQKNIVITNKDISDGGVIPAGSSKTYRIIISTSNPTVSVKLYSTEEEVPASLKARIMQANRNSISEETTEENLLGFIYTEKNVDFIVEFEELCKNSDEKYETNAIITIANYEDYKIDNLSFDLVYKNKNLNYEQIKTYSLNQILSNESKSSYSLYENDGIEANENKICKINGFITDEKFSGFEITNVKYTTIKETAINTSVENISNIVVNEYTSINQNENLIYNNIIENTDD